MVESGNIIAILFNGNVMMEDMSQQLPVPSMMIFAIVPLDTISTEERRQKLCGGDK